MAQLCVGIDLGTTFSVVAVCRRGRVEVIANDSGSRTTPSVVGFLDGEDFVGEGAKDLPPEQQIFDVKRLLGRTADEVQEDAKEWPFKVAQQGGELTLWVAQGDVKALQPVEVLAMMVKSLKESAEMFLAQGVPRAVLTVPPYFSAKQREAVKKAGEWAGLEVLQLVSEAEAVAEAYGLPADKSVLVLHVGGRSAYAWARPAQHGGGGAGSAAAACEHLDWGGSLLDQRLVDHCVKDIASKHGVPTLEASSLLELRAACEAAKRKLSSMPEATLSVYLSRHNLQYKASISRALFEDMCADLFGKILGLAKKALASAKLDAVDAVVLVGGSTRIHRLRSLVRAAFGRELKVSITPDEATAHGAAMRGAALCGDKPATVELRQEEDGGSTSSTQGQGASSGSSSGTSGGSSSGSSGGAHGGSKTKQTSGSGSKGSREAPAVGIDLGTTFSVVAVCRKGRVEVIANDSGSRTTPSIVGFLDGASYVGEAAKDLLAEQRVFDAKRLIGRPWGDPSIQEDMKHWPFEVLGSGGVPRIRINLPGVTETFAPEEISAMVLRSLKETAESFLGAKVSKAVITVPAYFNERQRQATMEAGKIAGLEVLSIINEPTSAAIAYGLDKRSSIRKTVFIFDLGGGTFDVSVMTIDGTDFTVLASGGDTHLGGQDFDVKLMEHFKREIQARHGVSQLDKQATQDLRSACELAKRKLSAVAEASVTLYSSRDGVRLAASVTRACFEDLCADLFQKTMDISEAVLRDANVSRDAIDEVVLVGGSTRIPKVRSMLSAFFGGKALRHSINPDEAVAYGAAVQAAVLSGDKFFDNLVNLKDVTPLSLGIELVGGRFSAIIPKNSAVPCKKTKRYSTAADYQEYIPIDVFQGERPFVKDNHDLDKMFCIEVPPKPAGETNVDVTFEIDADGLLTVTCEDPSSARKAEIKINQKDSQRSDKEIREMIEKAKRFRREDQDELKQVEENLRQQRLI